MRVSHLLRTMKACFAALLFLCSYVPNATAQITPDSLLDKVYDRFGHSYSLGEIAINDALRASYSGPAAMSGASPFTPLTIPPAADCNSGYFQLFLEEGCGMENYATDADHAARKNVLCQVLHDISQFIQSPLSAPGSTQKVNIWVRKTTATAPGPGNLAVATPFFNMPYSITKSGIVDNTAWITINSGKDAFTNVASPLVTSGGGGVGTATGMTFFHGSIVFDFSHVFTTNMTDGTQPAAGASDLYTTALHEMLHMLGFMSTIDITGGAYFGPGYHYYSRYDTHLKTAGGTKLITHTATGSAACDKYEWQFNPDLTPGTTTPAASLSSSGLACGGTPPDLTDCTTDIRYVGSTTQKVYTPACFGLGSSLSHFEDACPPISANDAYFVMSNGGLPGPYSTTPGCRKRAPTPEERKVLCDIGYRVNTTFGESTDVNHNYVTYTGESVCGQQVAGINDGIGAAGGFIYHIPAGGTAHLNCAYLLSNDHNATGGFKCLEVVVGAPGAVFAGIPGSGICTGADIVDFTPGTDAFGVQLLRYIPIDLDGNEGNITYVYVDVDDPDCIATACDLIRNGDFENTDPGSVGSSFPGVHCWKYNLSPDIFSSGITTPSSWAFPATGTGFFNPLDVHLLSVGNAHFAGIAGGTPVAGLWNPETIYESLTSSINPDQTYRLSFFAHMNDASGAPITPQHLYFVLNPLPLAGFPEWLAGVPAGCTLFKDAIVEHPNSDWQYYWYDIHYPAGADVGNSIAIYLAGWETGARYVALDEISIIPSSEACNWVLPSTTLCSTSPLIDLSTTVSIPGPDPVFSWITTGGVVTHDVMFDPALACAANIAAGGTGFVTLSYTYGPAWCRRTIYKQIQITAISGLASVCVGSTITLTGAPAGGTWSSSASGIAPVTAGGEVTGSAVGAATISYTMPDGCVATYDIVVNPAPAAISGPSSICVGATVTLTDATPGGVWQNSTPSVATVDAAGVLNGVATGLTLVDYTLPTGCKSSLYIHVYDWPAPITGPSSVCEGGGTIALADVTTGGTWTVSPAGFATVSSAGVVTGFVAGTVTVSYSVSLAACYATKEIEVKPLPEPITGNLNVCLGSTTVLADATPGGAWHDDGGPIASVDAAGVVTGLALGTAEIDYVLPTGCMQSVFVTVNPLPADITGVLAVCVGSSITLTDATAGGTWSVSNTNAIVTPGGVVTGVTAGSVTVTYQLSTGCFKTKAIDVNPLPAAIAGTLRVCKGSVTTLSSLTTGGTWSVADVLIAMIDPGSIMLPTNQVAILGVAAGTTTVTYTISTGCYATAVVTVDPLPTAFTGSLAVCPGSSTTLGSTPTGGTWVSADATIATVNLTTGVVTGLNAGTVQITYTTPAGCKRAEIVTVNPLPGPIGGIVGPLCVGSSVLLSSSPTTGTWSSSNPVVADFVTSPGVLTGSNVGTTSVTYTLPTGCRRSIVVSVITLPTVAPITGVLIACVGSTTNLSDATAGGVWTSSNTSVATVDASGIVTGISTGTVTISYSVTNICGTTVVTSDIHVGPPTVPAIITGALGVCSGSTTTLYNTTTGGAWVSSDPTKASVGATGVDGTGAEYAVINGIAAGMVTIDYTVANACGTVTTSTNVVVDQQPYITTNTTTGCQGFCVDCGGPVIVSDVHGCVQACEDSWVRYYPHGVAGSTFTWEVYGAVSWTDYGTYIEVHWPTLTPGMTGLTGHIVLHGAFSHCIGTADVDICIIPKPKADFNAPTDACLNDVIHFENLSSTSASGASASAIVSYYWDFGDGYSSPVFEPTHAYTASGVYVVTLTVKNECNCSSTITKTIKISDRPGQTIVCASIVCEGETATYSVGTNDCGSYSWAVNGGHITSGAGTSSITVVWDDPSAIPGGFGNVSVYDACSDCPEWVSVKIPVILSAAAIDGDPQCINKDYFVKLPLWGGTDYHWGVLDHPECVVSAREDHKVILHFYTAGTYTIHASYQNRVKLCGGDVFKIVTILDEGTISGDTKVCLGSTQTYVLSGSYSGDWTVTDASTGSVVGTGPTSNSFTYTFSSPGTYAVYANAGICVKPVTVIVEAGTPAVTTITGETTVCLGKPYTYKALPAVPYTTYDWDIVGGTMVPGSGSDEVSVVWSSTGLKTLSVTRLNTQKPYCPSVPYTITISHPTGAPHITGDALPCANAERFYESNYDGAEVYDWEINPTTLGSVEDPHDQNTGVVWNNVISPTPGYVKVTVRRCDIVQTDIFNVVVQPGQTVTLDAVPSVCARQPVTFHALTGAAMYTWDFGDGTSSTTTINSVTTQYENPGTTNVTYNVVVTATPTSSSYAADCPIVGSATVPVTVKATPPLLVISDVPTVCSTIANVVVISPFPATPYTWEAAYGAYTHHYTLGSSGMYNFTATYPNGCVGKGQLALGECPPCAIPAFITPSCNSVLLSATTSLPGSWTCDQDPLMDIPAGNPVTVIVPTAGFYSFTFHESSGSGCEAHVNTTIAGAPNFHWSFACAGGGMTNVNIFGDQTVVAGSTITSTTYTAGSVPFTPPLSVVAGSTVTIQQTIAGPPPVGTCSISHVVNVPAQPTAAFTYATSPICENVMILFTPVTTGSIVSYHWDFGDGTSLLTDWGARAYATPPFDPTNYFVTLTVTDENGCSVTSASSSMEIHKKSINALISPGDVVACSAALPVVLTASIVPLSGTPPFTYLWSDGETLPSINVTTSGNYWVTVKDVYQCQNTFPTPTRKVQIIKTPPPVIVGKTDYCPSDVINLSCQAGSDVTYQWFMDGIAIPGANSAEYSTPVVTYPFSHNYQVQLTVVDLSTSPTTTCSEMSPNHPVTVHLNPANPVITGPVLVNCDNYSLELTASESVVGKFTWSDGASSPEDVSSHVHGINVGGPYRVVFTDLFGCSSFDEKDVPPAPETWMPYFPSGCYDLCAGQMPLRLNGPPAAFLDYWAWLKNTIPDLVGYASFMDPYVITGDGSYQWTISNDFSGVLCSRTSDPMDVRVSACDRCQQVQATVKDIACDPSNPSSYNIFFSFVNPAPGTYYSIGTDNGPVAPFNGTTSTAPIEYVPLVFTTLTPTALPATITIYTRLTYPTGERCFLEVPVTLPDCHWMPEKHGDTTRHSQMQPLANANDAMLVYPNPASGEVTVSYDYGKDGGVNRNITVYDVIGRKMDATQPSVRKGLWKINVKDWAPGIYLVRMEGDGNALHTQRVVISNQ